MTRRALLLTDGSSDAPLGEHLEQMCAERGVEVRVTVPDLRRLPNPPGLGVAERLSALAELEGEYELIFVHRDAEKQNPVKRVTEVHAAVAQVCPATPAVPVVPVRMTEAWLLLDHELIRDVAGQPNGSMPLDLPKLSKVELDPDPKERLRVALETASALQGRRLARFRRRFNENRRLLLQLLDIHGPVRQLTAWQELEASLERALDELA